MNLAGALLAAATATLVAYSLMSLPRRLDLGLLARSAPSAERDFLARLGRTRIVRTLTRWDRQEARSDVCDLSKAAAWCVLAAIALTLVGVSIRQPMLLLLVPATFRVPSWVGARATRARKRSADHEIPQLLDLLAAASTAGLAAPLALRRCVEPLHGPLADEVRASLRAVDLGGRWSEEMTALAVRLDLPDLSRATTLLARTETLGSSLAESMSDLADHVRAERRAKRTERARAAPVKMLFPLVFLVLPAFLLLTVVPVFLTTLRSI